MTNTTDFNKKLAEHKRIFAELEDFYKLAFEKFDTERKKKHPEPFLCGATWWSLPPKMWRIAKSLGFENDKYSRRNRKWTSYNTLSGFGDYDCSSAAQRVALEALREKYPNSVLLKNISSGGWLD